MTAQRRELRRAKRELAEHNRVQQLKHDLRVIARGIRNEYDLSKALAGFDGPARAELYTAMKPHLAFNPAE